MSEIKSGVIFEAIPNQKQANKLLSRLYDVAQPNAVFSEPVVSGEHTVIMAQEVSVTLGTGYGGGGGIGTPGGEQVHEHVDESGGGGIGIGSGGGGGGTATARPVAVITISPDGVHVEPIVDPTKISLAFFTTIGAVFMMVGRMRRMSRKGSRA